MQLPPLYPLPLVLPLPCVVAVVVAAGAEITTVGLLATGAAVVGKTATGPAATEELLLLLLLLPPPWPIIVFSVLVAAARREPVPSESLLKGEEQSRVGAVVAVVASVLWFETDSILGVLFKKKI
jgi:hypothetical protein